jgi:hypothetical protein
MTPEEAKKARAKHDAQKKYANANKEKVRAKDSAPKNQQYQKEYRAANKGKRLLLGRTADTSGWSAQARRAHVSTRATGAMVGPRRTGGDEAEAARGNLCGSKRVSRGGWGVANSATAHLVDALRVEV